MAADEQAGELDALEAIYADELGIYCRDYPSVKFRIRVRSDQDGMVGDAMTAASVNEATEEAEPSESSDDDDEEEETPRPLRCMLVVSFPADYPESSPPSIRVRGLVRRIGAERKRELLGRLVAVAEENVGMASVFTVVSELQEGLGNVQTQMAADTKAAAEALRKAEEEAEDARFQGTIVTKDSFMAWRAAFNEEMGHARKKREEEAAKAKRRPTGKEQFLRDATLSLSDIQFIKDEALPPDADCDVQVDESLFEDLDDLDLETD